MLNPNYSEMLSKAPNYIDGAAYISDVAVSSVWGDGADLSQTSAIASVLWQIYSEGIKPIRAATGYSMAKFGAIYGIPTRTLENWEGAKRKPPYYVLLLLAHDVGLLP